MFFAYLRDCVVEQCAVVHDIGKRWYVGRQMDCENNRDRRLQEDKTATI